jgi:hypothetical protein
LGDFLPIVTEVDQLSATFSTYSTCHVGIIVDKKWVGRHFWATFQKLVWSPWFCVLREKSEAAQNSLLEKN